MTPVLTVPWANTASAGPDAGSEDPLAITTSAGRFEVTGRAPVAPARLERADRTCVVALGWSPSGTAVEARGCPEAVAPDVVRAVSRWVVAPPDGATGHHDLGELWFVYPFEEEGPPRVLVRQSHERLLSLPSDIDAAPFAIRAWSFVR